MYMQLYNLDALISLMSPYMYSALLPVSALSRLNLASPPCFECVFINKHPYSNKHPHSKKGAPILTL